MKLKTTSLAAFTAFTIAGSASAATLLLSDNFNSTTRNGATFNDNLATDQNGSLVTVPYALSNLVSSDGSMVLNFQGNSGWGAWASPNHNFAADANTANSPLEIQFAMWTDSAAGNDGWVGFGLGSTQGGNFLELPYGFNVTQAQGQHTYKLVITDTVGTGSGFNGITNGAKVETFIDGVSQGFTAKTFATDGGYITFRTTASNWGGGSSWGLGHVDNLSVSLVPEPGAALLGGLGMLVLLRRRR